MTAPADSRAGGLRHEPAYVVARVSGGWQLYDATERRHVGKVFRRQAAAERRVESLRRYRPAIQRFIMADRGADNG